MDSKPHQTLNRLVSLLSLEDRARNCRSRREAQDCIVRADATKRALWGTTDVAIDGHY
ncbi:MAG: hypothetical protein VKK03_02715 [Synechococcus sp.]|nr:hypothetical protein [Synechococcus sp.]